MYSDRHSQRQRITSLLMVNMLVYLFLGLGTLAAGMLTDPFTLDSHLVYDLLVVSIKGFLVGGSILFVYDELPIH